MINTHHDARPRLHIWPTLQGYAWSFGPRGNRTHWATFVECVADAFAAVGLVPFVIIVEAQG